MRVHHLALRTRDLPRLESFYAGVLGLPPASHARSDRSVWLVAGETLVMLERAADGEPAVPHGAMDLVAFAIDRADVARFRRALAERGVAIEGETQFTMYFRDPDGRRVALSHYAYPASHDASLDDEKAGATGAETS